MVDMGERKKRGDMREWKGRGEERGRGEETLERGRERRREGWIGRGEERADIGEGKRDTIGRDEGKRR